MKSRSVHRQKMYYAGEIFGHALQPCLSYSFFHEYYLSPMQPHCKIPPGHSNDNLPPLARGIRASTLKTSSSTTFYEISQPKVYLFRTMFLQQ